MIDLPTIWFVLIGVLLVGYAVLDGFDLGVGVLSPFIGRSQAERGLLMEAVGPVWDGNEVWLLTMGGALFAAFPLVYATVFSGFYLALMLLLLGLIMRAVAMEFRHQISDPALASCLGRRVLLRLAAARVAAGRGPRQRGARSAARRRPVPRRTARIA